jgi:hypothetical protein
MALDRCVTGVAYEIRLSLPGIQELKDANEARQLSRNWCTSGARDAEADREFAQANGACSPDE